MVWIRTFLVFLLVAFGQTAQAQEEVVPRTALETANDAFAAYVVGPMATVMFYDIVFWDNNLTPNQAIGTEHDGLVVMEHGPNGYTLRERFAVDTAIRYIDPAESIRLGQLDVNVRTASSKGSDGQPLWTLIGAVPSQKLDLASLGAEPMTPTGIGADGLPLDPIVTVTKAAPFPVRVDRATGMTIPLEIQLRPEQAPVRVGDTVITSDGRIAEAQEVGPPLTLLDATAQTRVEPFANPTNVNIPIVVAWLVFGAVFFTFRMMFVNLRAFPHAIMVVTGRYDDEEEEGEISHFQALSSALSATVGLGNIAGVAVAVSAGGPGAVFWMVVAGFLGMSSKFTECTLGQMYRVTRADGSVSGGPMHYLDKGLEEMGIAPFGKILAVVFAVMCVGGSLGGGNMFQANQSFASIFGVLLEYQVLEEAQRTSASVAFGMGLAFLVGLVIIGGIKRIGAAAGVIVPVMCAIYLLAGAAVLVVNADQVPAAIMSIVNEAFTPAAGLGGMAGVLIQGFRRAAFSNEAGVGSASIAHSAATTNYPVREGIVALLEPFIDTIVVCTMTGLVVVVTGAYQQPGVDGVMMTSHAFGSVFSWFPVLLSVAVLLFAFSTMISWSYYGERCITWLFGDMARTPYRIFFLTCVFFGSVFNLGPVLDFSDLMILGMAFPNILGLILLSGKVKAALDVYWAKLNAGEFAK